MKRVSLILLLLGITASIIAQNVPQEVYSKVFNPAFSKNYAKTSVIITGEFFSPKAPTYVVYPTKLKNYVKFQCVDVGEQGKSDQLSGEAKGEVFCIDKSKSDIIFSLKKGDLVKITGKTYTVSYSGNFSFDSVYFIVSNIEKIDDAIEK